jgi:phosphohistidine swiveling domain-containing protein
LIQRELWVERPKLAALERGTVGGGDDGVDIHAPGPVNQDPGRARWHRGNVGEVLPGVSTPLNADFWRPSMESGLLGTFHRLGLADTHERGGRDGAASPYAGRICRFFYGRLASDFDIVLDLFARMPGVDPRLLEEQFLGESAGAARPRPSLGRAAIAITRSAQALASLPVLVGRRTKATQEWWRAATATAVEPGRARALFVDGQTRLRVDLELQITVAMLQAALVDRLGAIVRRAMGDDDLLPALVAGIAGIEEGHMMEALWRVARGGAPMAGFLARYGYYGPDEGELSMRSWREDPVGLERVLDAYRSMSEAESPAARLRARAAEARAARARVLRAASGRDRAALRSLWPLARNYTARREEGKALMLRCVDVGRAAARAIGAARAAAGMLDAPDDVFFLIQRELDGDADAGAHVATRRAQHRAYQDLVVPLAFHGPELRRLVETAPRPLASGGDAIRGLGVSPGAADGIARIVTDPLACDAFMPGEILVCVTTDPGWSPLLSVAAGVVLDAGSMLSHGAIVARELGVPCVANTVDGTRRIADGARVRVDGTAGVVTILDRRPGAETGSAA